MNKLAFLLLVGVCVAAPIFTAFNSGEISPRMKYRVDLDKRHFGVEKMENMTVKAQGAAFRRPGLEFIGETNDVDVDARMIPFEFSTVETYVLVFEHENLGFYRTIP